MGGVGIFDVMLCSGTVCDLMYRHFCLKNVPTLLKCTENAVPKCTHLYEMYGKFSPQLYPSVYANAGQILFKDIQRTSFLKIYRMLSGKMLPPMIKCTGNRTVKSTHSDKIYKTWIFFIRIVAHNE